jgi:hypothetical protein
MCQENFFVFFNKQQTKKEGKEEEETFLSKLSTMLRGREEDNSKDV